MDLEDDDDNGLSDSSGSALPSYILGDEPAKEDAKNADNVENADDEAAKERKVNQSVVKDLGRKARERLQEERSKRREIVRLDDDDDKDALVPNTAVKKRPRTFLTDRAAPKRPRTQRKNKKQRMTVSSARKSVRSVRRKSSAMTLAEAARNSIAHLPTGGIGKDARSSWVRLHGVPPTATPMQIHRFLGGLLIKTICTLPPFRPIAAFDEKRMTNRTALSRVDTAATKVTRVLVQLGSSGVAALATARTGETLEDANETPVAVSTVPKATAKFLSENLMIPFGGSSTSSIQEAQQEALRDLNPLVVETLWSFALTECRLLSSCDGATEDDGWSSSSSSSSSSSAQWSLETIRRQRKLAMNERVGPIQLIRIHNKLVDRLNTIETGGRNKDSKLWSACVRLLEAEIDAIASELKVLREFTAYKLQQREQYQHTKESQRSDPVHE